MRKAKCLKSYDNDTHLNRRTENVFARQLSDYLVNELNQNKLSVFITCRKC